MECVCDIRVASERSSPPLSVGVLTTSHHENVFIGKYTFGNVSMMGVKANFGGKCDARTGSVFLLLHTW